MTPQLLQVSRMTDVYIKETGLEELVNKRKGVGGVHSSLRGYLLRPCQNFLFVYLTSG